MHPPMVEQELTYQKLQIPSSDIYEAMGYKDSMPDGMVIEEINTLLDRITPLLRPRFFFFLTDGLLDTEKATLTVKIRFSQSVKPLPANYGVRKPLPFLPPLRELNLRSFNICFSKRTTW